MLIHIKKDANGKQNNLAIIELQGDLQWKNDFGVDNKYVGDLHYTKDGTPMLLIGYHLLSGKEVDMIKPLVLLEKIKEQGTEYMIKSIIRKKLIFKTRPTPIVSM